MQNRIVDTLLPTTMVGSYPRPHWFTHQLLGRDVRVAFKEVQHEEAYDDAVATVIRDQEEAGLDIVTDGNMWYDDYVGSIGAFCWYLYERIPGFEPAREPHPSFVNAEASFSKAMFDDWGGVINSGPVKCGPIRWADLYKRREEAREGAGQGVRRRRPRQPRVARVLQSLQELEGAQLRADPHLQRGDEEPRRRGREVSPDRGPRSLAAAFHGRQERLHVDQGCDRPVLRRREREDRLALLFRQRLGQTIY